MLSPEFKTPKEIFSRQGHFSPPVSDQGARRLCGRTDDARAEYSGWEQADMERSRAVHTLPGDGRWDPKCVQRFCGGHGISQEISTRMALMCG